MDHDENGNCTVHNRWSIHFALWQTQYTSFKLYIPFPPATRAAKYQELPEIVDPPCIPSLETGQQSPLKTCYTETHTAPSLVRVQASTQRPLWFPLSTWRRATSLGLSSAGSFGHQCMIIGGPQKFLPIFPLHPEPISIVIKALYNVTHYNVKRSRHAGRGGSTTVHGGIWSADESKLWNHELRPHLVCQTHGA